MLKNRFSQNIWMIFAWIVAIALLLSGCAQKTKVYKVGILTYKENFSSISNGFKDQMTSLGYIEGQNIAYEVREADPTADAAENLRLAQELIDADVDLIFAFPTPSVFAAHTATQGTDIPVVFAYYQIEGSTLIQSVSEPGGNMTGVRYPGPELMGRRLELLLEIAPEVKRIWIGYDQNHTNTALALEALRSTAQNAGVTLVEIAATKMDELETDLATRETLSDIGIDAILVMPDGFSTSSTGFAMLSEFAADHKLPIAGGISSQIEQGALFFNGIDNSNVGKLAAPLADKIFKGTQAGTIPVVTPEQTLEINYKLAQTIGLTIPEGLLRIADNVIR